ncbi:MAG: hypothetical protein RL026_673 [Pseudomonadota bacterium]|jgi:uncharacterized protein (DUF934 family)
MAEILKNGAIVDSPWVAGTVADLATGAPLVLPLADYLAWRAGAPAAADLARVAVSLQPADDALALQGRVDGLPLVVVEFPEFKEGRGYTQARLLRERLGYAGELRASGAVRVDLVYHLARCGFDSFVPAPGEKPAALLAELQRFSVAYQPCADGLTQPRRRYGG